MQKKGSSIIFQVPFQSVRGFSNWVCNVSFLYYIIFVYVLCLNLYIKNDFFFRVTLSLNLYYIAINHTSATFAAATTNTIPAITLLLALLFRYLTWLLFSFFFKVRLQKYILFSPLIIFCLEFEQI